MYQMTLLCSICFIFKVLINLLQSNCKRLINQINTFKITYIIDFTMALKWLLQNCNRIFKAFFHCYLFQKQTIKHGRNRHNSRLIVHTGNSKLIVHTGNSRLIVHTGNSASKVNYSSTIVYSLKHSAHIK